MEHLDINLDMCEVDHISGDFKLVLSCHCYSCDNTLYNTLRVHSGTNRGGNSGGTDISQSQKSCISLFCWLASNCWFLVYTDVLDDCVCDCDCPIFVQHNL